MAALQKKTTKGKHRKRAFEREYSEYMDLHSCADGTGRLLGAFELLLKRDKLLTADKRYLHFLESFARELISCNFDNLASLALTELIKLSESRSRVDEAREFADPPRPPPRFDEKHLCLLYRLVDFIEDRLRQRKIYGYGEEFLKEALSLIQG